MRGSLALKFASEKTVADWNYNLYMRKKDTEIITVDFIVDHCRRLSRFPRSQFQRSNLDRTLIARITDIGRVLCRKENFASSAMTSRSLLRAATIAATAAAAAAASSTTL